MIFSMVTSARFCTEEDQTIEKNAIETQAYDSLPRLQTTKLDVESERSPA
jgi:hypothetical protein